MSVGQLFACIAVALFVLAALNVPTIPNAVTWGFCLCALAWLTGGIPLGRRE